MAAEKDAKLIEVTLLRQHPNNTRPASVQTSVQSQNLTLAAIAVEKQGGRLPPSKNKVDGYCFSLSGVRGAGCEARGARSRLNSLAAFADLSV